MTLRLARTNREAHLYLQLHPCPSCGDSSFAPTGAVVAVGGDLASRYAGPCPQCGVHREFVFRIPQEVILPDENNPAFGNEQPSELIDAGQWLRLADTISKRVPAEPPPDLPPHRLQQVRHDLLAAAAAVDEVVKFVPAGADTVPRAAMWTHTGRAMYDTDPGRFHRRRLDAVRRTYRDLAQRFTSPHQNLRRDAMTDAAHVLDVAIAAATAGDLNTLRGLIDWPLSGAGTVSRGLSAVLPQDRARVVASGLTELDAAANHPDLVDDVLRDDVVPRLAGAQTVRQASAQEAGSVLASLQVPAELPAEITSEQLTSLAELRRRAAQVREVHVVVNDTGEWPFAWAPDSGQLVLFLPD